MGTFGLVFPDCGGLDDEALDSDRVGGFIGVLEWSRGKDWSGGLCTGRGKSNGDPSRDWQQP